MESHNSQFIRCLIHRFQNWRSLANGYAILRSLSTQTYPSVKYLKRNLYFKTKKRCLKQSDAMPYLAAVEMETHLAKLPS